MNNDRQKKEARTANSTYPKVAVQWLNQDLCLGDSEVLLNRHLRVAAKLWRSFPIFPKEINSRANGRHWQPKSS
jgi:hypothetical protein